MARTPNMDYPDWVLPYKTQGMEIKLVNGRYYLYQISCTYERETQKRRKTSKYLGIITEDGLIEPRMTTIEKIKSSINIRDVECGVSEFFLQHAQSYCLLLQKHFPHNWQQIIAVAYTRLLYQCPIRHIEAFWNKSYLSEVYKIGSLNEEDVNDILKNIGSDQKNLMLYCMEFGPMEESIVFGDPCTLDSLDNEYDSLVLEKLKIVSPEDDEAYMLDSEVRTGWMLTVFVAMQWYNSISHFLSESGIRDKMSTKSAIQYLMNIRRVWLFDQWVVSEITPQEKKLLKALKINLH